MNELESILNELDQPAGDNGLPRRAELCHRGLALVSKETEPRLWAELQDELGNVLTQTSSGESAEDFEAAIEAFERALEVRTREAMPVEWAETMNHLASVYLDRIVGKPAENISTWTEIFPQNPSRFHYHHGDDMKEASNPWKATWHHPPISETIQR